MTRASGWIKFDKDMLDDPRLIAAAAQLAERIGGSGSDRAHDVTRNMLARYALRGALVTLWIYADTHIRDDDTLPIGALDALNAFIGIEGFASLLPREWIDELDDGTVILPGYCEKNSLIAKRKRATDAANRMRRFRARNADRDGEHARDVTPLVTQNETQNVTRHEVGNGVRTNCVDLDLDLDLKKSIHTQGATESVPRGTIGDPLTLTMQQQEQLQAAYPKFAGRQNWITAIRAACLLVESGQATFEALLQGVTLYAAFIEASGATGSQFVLSPVRFFGDPDRPWAQPWEVGTARADSIHGRKGPRSAAQLIKYRPDPEEEARLAAARGGA